MAIEWMSKELCIDKAAMEYWASQFKYLFEAPDRLNSGDLTDRDSQILKEIYRLIHCELYTINGAKRLLDAKYCRH